VIKLKKSKESIEIALPSKAIRVSHAKCPNGCDLMDESLKISGYPSIVAKITYQSKEGLIHLDPVFGSFNNILEVDVPDMEVVELACPKCGVSLKGETDTCNVCSAPMFIINLPKGAIIEACLRKGCFEHTFKIVKAEELLKRLFDEQVLDSYL
jgi:hypothetical protein